MKIKYKQHILFIIIGLFLLSFSQYSDNADSWVIDIFSQFPVQYALSAMVILTICLWKRIISLAIFSVILFFCNLNVLINPGIAGENSVRSENTFKVYSANINRFNTDISKLMDDVVRADTEIVLLLEVTPAHLERMTPLIQMFPYHIARSPIGTHELGIVLLSKFPILDNRLIKLSEAGNALLEATLEINKNALIFYGTHLQNPVFAENFSDRKKQFLELAQKICRRSEPVIIAGDLNETPFSPIFKELIRISGLRDSTKGFGWQPSWPANFPFLWLPIDHILVSPEIHVLNRTTGSFIGSDHYPVFAELSID